MSFKIKASVYNHLKHSREELQRLGSLLIILLSEQTIGTNYSRLTFVAGPDERLRPAALRSDPVDASRDNKQIQIVLKVLLLACFRVVRYDQLMMMMVTQV